MEVTTVRNYLGVAIMITVVLMFLYRVQLFWAVLITLLFFFVMYGTGYRITPTYGRWEEKGTIDMVVPQKSAIVICEFYPEELQAWIDKQKEKGIVLKMRLGRLGNVWNVVVIADTGAYIDIKQNNKGPVVVPELFKQINEFFLENSVPI